jgi:peptidoglycan/xylan/chitin deacetylase (PgdA/CDA1 family)
MAVVKILLTFDDGPHAAAGPGNRTRKVLQALKLNGIIGVFYIQTGVSYRMGSPEGVKVVKEANGLGPLFEHVIEIHTAGKEDHQKHWSNPDLLAKDLPKAIAAIEKATTRRPKTIRSVGLELANPNTSEKARETMANRLRAIYAASSLKHIGINVDSYDNTKAFWHTSIVHTNPTASEVQEALRKGIEFALQAGPQDLIVLFHDINGTTANNLGSYITAIRNAVTNATHTPSFTQSRAEVELFLSNTAIDSNRSWPLDKQRR